MTHRTRSSLEIYTKRVHLSGQALNSEPFKVIPKSMIGWHIFDKIVLVDSLELRCSHLPSNQAAFIHMKQFTYFSPIDIISTLRNDALWNNEAETEFEKLSRDAFIEIILASCLQAEESYEGFFIFVLRPLDSEQSFFKLIYNFLQSFFLKIEISILPTHVHDLMSEIETLAVLSSGVDNDKSKLFPPPEKYASPQSIKVMKPQNDSFDYLNISGKSYNNTLRSRKILVYSVNALRSYGGIVTGSQAPLSRFLAYLRKLGMDVIFPQNSHDMLLCFIYATLSSNLSNKMLTIDLEEENRRKERGT